jgi:hypothetical protein
MAFVPVISSPKQTTLVVALFCRAWFPNYTNNLHRDLNQGQVFGVVASFFVIFSSKQTTLVLVTFFYRA